VGPPPRSASHSSKTGFFARRLAIVFPWPAASCDDRAGQCFAVTELAVERRGWKTQEGRPRPPQFWRGGRGFVVLRALFSVRRVISLPLFFTEQLGRSRSMAVVGPARGVAARLVGGTRKNRPSLMWGPIRLAFLPGGSNPNFTNTSGAHGPRFAGESSRISVWWLAVCGGAPYSSEFRLNHKLIRSIGLRGGGAIPPG